MWHEQTLFVNRQGGVAGGFCFIWLALGRVLFYVVLLGALKKGIKVTSFKISLIIYW